MVGLALPSVLSAAGILFTYSEGLATAACILFSVGAAAISFFMYRRATTVIRPRVSIPLGILRYLVLLMVALLLLEPRLESKEKLSAAPVIAVLHDDSESMVIHRDSNYVKTNYPQQLQSFMDKLQSDKVTTEFYGFSQNLIDDARPDSLSFARSGTNISGALEQASKLYANQNLGAVVLVSDGISTAGVNPVYTLDQFQLPIYTVLLGDTTPQKDVKIVDVLFNQIAYLENETPIKVKLKTEGYEAGQLTVTIRGEGKAQGSQVINIDPAVPNPEVDFLVKPSKTGVIQYSIAVSPLPDEVTTKNNYKNIFINVLETKVKIALFGGFPHPDIGALRNTFERDDRYEVTEFIHKNATSFYNSPDGVDLKAFDLIILHNFPFNQSDVPLLDKIKEQVNARKIPLMAFIGKYTQVPTLYSSLGEKLGIVPGSPVNTVEEAQVNFKPEYKNHSTFTFDDRWINLMNSSPPIFRNQSEWKSSGDTRVFATARIKNIALDYPIYGLQNHLGHKNMVFIGENIWRMRAHAMVEEKDFASFDQWIYNNIQWLIVKEDKRKFKVNPSKKLFTGQEPAIFRGEAYDDSYNPIPGVDIKLSLKSPDGKEEVYFMNETGNARYFLELNNLSEGTYEYVAEGVKNEKPIGTDRGQFSIGKSNIEHFQLTANNGLMEQIALRTGGKFVYARQIETLAPEIMGLNSLKPVVSFLTKRLGFNEYRWIFFLALALLTLEWVVRKRFSLS